MEILNGSEDSYLYFENAVTDKNTELELIFGSVDHKNPITRRGFIRILDLCKGSYELLSES